MAIGALTARSPRKQFAFSRLSMAQMSGFGRMASSESMYQLTVIGSILAI